MGRKLLSYAVGGKGRREIEDACVGHARPHLARYVGQHFKATGTVTG